MGSTVFSFDPRPLPPGSHRIGCNVIHQCQRSPPLGGVGEEGGSDGLDGRRRERERRFGLWAEGRGEWGSSAAIQGKERKSDFHHRGGRERRGRRTIKREMVFFAAAPLLLLRFLSPLSPILNGRAPAAAAASCLAAPLLSPNF